MSVRTDLLLINPPMGLIQPDYPRHGMFTRFIQPAIHPGLLSIASVAAAAGFSVRIADYSVFGALEGDRPSRFSFEDVIRELRTHNPKVVGISSTSVFDYLECGQLAAHVKRWDPEAVCIGGGQNVSALGKIALADVPEFDAVVIGEGEHAVRELLERIARHESIEGTPGLMYRVPGGTRSGPAAPPVDLDALPVPRFDLYPGYDQFIPFVEESRGCWGTCKFCANGTFYGAGVRSKSPETLERELANAVQYFGTAKVFALTTSIFSRTSRATVQAFCDVVRPFGIRWTTQTRCDAGVAAFLPALADAGLFLLNLGLESASPEILRRMHKSEAPERYLAHASELLEAAGSIGLWVCCNLVLYPGETRATLQETLAFLVKHRRHIAAIVSNPTFGFPGTDLWRDPSLATRHGGVLVETPYSRATHHFPIAPSREFGLEAIGFFSEVLEKVFTLDPILDVELDYRDMDASSVGRAITRR